MKRRSSQYARAAMALLAMGLVAACSSQGSSNQTSGPSATTNSKSDTFNIASVEPLSGAYAALGQVNVAAFKAEIAIINSEGGILGHHLVLTVRDDASTAQTAIDATRQLLSSGNVNLFIDDSTLATTLLPYAKNVLAIDGCGDAICGDGVKWPDHFTINATYDDQVGALLSYAHSKGLKSVGVLADSGAEGEGFVQAATQQGEKYGVKVVSEQYYDLTAASYTPQLESLRAAGAQAVIADLIGTTVSTAMTGMQSLGWGVPVISDQSAFVGNVDSEVPAAVQAQLVGVVFRWAARPAGGMQDAPPYIYHLYQETSKYSNGSILSFGVAASAAESIAEAAWAYTAVGSLNTQKAVGELDHIMSAKNVPVDTFPFWYGLNPSYQGTVHSTQAAQVQDGFFAVVHPGTFQNGTYVGTVFKY